jgi:hypothetical protein
VVAGLGFSTILRASIFLLASGKATRTANRTLAKVHAFGDDINCLLVKKCLKRENEDEAVSCRLDARI